MVSGAVLVSDADADDKKHDNKKVGFYLVPQIDYSVMLYNHGEGPY